MPRPDRRLFERPTPDLLLRAYRAGWFPMADPISGAMEWFSPDPRGILPLDAFHVPRSLERVMRSTRFDIRDDTAFEDVMRACAVPREESDLTWIDERLIEAYTALHAGGHAHSVEAWRDGRLVGGLYGVHVGGAFFGESMFSSPDEGGTDASKTCLAALVRRMRARGFRLLDTQFWTPHLGRFGCVEIERARYLELLTEAVELPVTWGGHSV